MKILLAEDDNDMRRFLAKALQNAGYDVLSFDNGLSAYNRLREEPFELLLTDIVMPEMDGIELARRATELDPDIKVMFITGFAAVALNPDSKPRRTPRCSRSPSTSATSSTKSRSCWRPEVADAAAPGRGPSDIGKSRAAPLYGGSSPAGLALCSRSRLHDLLVSLLRCGQEPADAEGRRLPGNRTSSASPAPAPRWWSGRAGAPACRRSSSARLMSAAATTSTPSTVRQARSAAEGAGRCLRPSSPPVSRCVSGRDPSLQPRCAGRRGPRRRGPGRPLHPDAGDDLPRGARPGADVRGRHRGRPRRDSCMACARRPGRRALTCRSAPSPSAAATRSRTAPT